MKILIGMPAKDSWGGPISSEPPFVSALEKAGQNVTEAIYVYGDKEKPTPIFKRIRRVLQTAFRFRKLLRNNNFDVLHLNTAFDFKTVLRDSFSLFVMNPKNTKTFLKLHGSEAQDFTDTNFIVRYLINYLANKVDGFGVHTSDELANFEKLGFDKSKFYFVKNVVTIHEVLPEDFQREHKKKNDQFELIFVARFVKKKCLLETIKACKLLKQQEFKFILYAIGDGETKSEAEDLVEKYELEDYVNFTGYIPEREVSEYFFKNDILVFPTKYGEGFPNAFFKAVAVGMPIVSTKFRAARDFLKEDKNYLPCQPTPESIAESIAKIIDNKSLRESMSKNNLEYGKSLLAENVAKEFLSIYQKITRGTRTARPQINQRSDIDSNQPAERH